MNCNFPAKKKEPGWINSEVVHIVGPRWMTEIEEKLLKMKDWKGIKNSMTHTIKLYNPLIQRRLKAIFETTDTETDLMTHYKNKLRDLRFTEFSNVF